MKKSFLLVLTLLLALLSSSAAVAVTDPWTPAQTLEPAQLVRVLKDSAKSEKPLILHVGFEFLFRDGHIPDSLYAGPGKSDDGLKRLRAAVAGVPHDREIVIYCGCCPLKKCPNVRPAFALLHELGYQNVKLLHVADSLEKNWVALGYPISK